MQPIQKVIGNYETNVIRNSNFQEAIIVLNKMIVTLFFIFFAGEIVRTGKSLSEALILAAANPQYDDCSLNYEFST